jgi:hypothetical protein
VSSAKRGNVLRRRILVSDEREKKSGRLANDEETSDEVEAHKKLHATSEAPDAADDTSDDVEAHRKFGKDA